MLDIACCAGEEQKKCKNHINYLITEHLEAYIIRSMIIIVRKSTTQKQY